MSMKKLAISAAVAAAMTSAVAQAEVYWSDASVSYLQAGEYKVPMSPNSPNDTTEGRQIITIEYANGTSWGDVFFFTDFSRSTDGAEYQSAYSEIQPRWSLGKLTGKQFAFGPVTDVLIATQAEFNNEDNGDTPGDDKNFVNTLVGVGVDLKVPGFDWFQLNGYARQNDKYANNFQLTPVWSSSFDVAGQRFVIDGFIDYTSGNDDVHETFHTQTQIKWDMGKTLLGEEKKLYLGVEYEYWDNKFGILDGSEYGFKPGVWDTEESQFQFLLKYHL